MVPTEADPGSSTPPVSPPDGVDASRFATAIVAIDAANAEDPNILVIDGVTRPKELAHAEAMTAWVRFFDPDADEIQLLAARAHHFQRWTYPRTTLPEGRPGYLKWRAEAKRRQAAAVGELLAGLGYDDPEIEGVQALVAKTGLGRGDLPDVAGRAPAVQTHEDALCLVFLTTQFEPVAAQLGEAKMVDVLARTLAKMGNRGRAAVLDLPLDDNAAAMVLAAVERVLPIDAADPVDVADLVVVADPVDVADLVDPVVPVPEGSGTAAAADGLDLLLGEVGPTSVGGEDDPPYAAGGPDVSSDVPDGGELDLGVALPRASTVRRAMLWGERPHPPPVSAPAPPLPLDAPHPAAAAAVSPPVPVAVSSQPNFSPARPELVATDLAEPVEFAVPPEPDLGTTPVDPFGLDVVVAKMSAGARRAGAVSLGILSTLLVEGEVVEAVVQGVYQHHAAVVALTTRRVLIVNDRHWAPDVRLVPIGADMVVQGWQDDRRATLLFGSGGRGLVVAGIVDRPLARDLARRVRELVASAGGPSA